MSADPSPLRESVAGSVLLPGDDGWDAARLPWNLSVDQHPLAVVEPADVDDVRAVLRFAHEAGVGVAVQPHGHAVGPDFANAVLVRPTRFDELTLDPAAGTARAGAGVDWGRVLTALDRSGFVALAGSNPIVSTVGYSLAGGHSAFGRAFGLAAQSITAIDLVRPDGEQMRVDAGSDPDLFWALRGGGGLFGVVTAIEFRLHPAPDGLYGGRLMFAASDAEAVFAAFAEDAVAAPDAVSLNAMALRFPDVDGIPAPLRGQTVAAVDVVSVAAPAATEAAIARVRAAATPLSDGIAAFTVGALPAVIPESTAPTAVFERSALLGSLEQLPELVRAFLATPEAFLLQVRRLGGALARTDAGHGVAGAIDAAAIVGASATAPPTGAVGDAVLGAPAAVLSAAEATIVPGRVATFLAAGEDLGGAYDAPALRRLAAVRKRLDPAHVMRPARALPAG